jgi:hypothetical protein
MNKKWSMTCGLLLCVAATALLVQAVEEKEKEKKKSEFYYATAIANGNMVRLTIIINSYTPDEEVQTLAETLKTNGPDALAKALEKTDRGQIAAGDQLGNTINVARTFQTDKGRAIRLLLNRPIGFLEAARRGRSMDYEFGLVELVVDEKGKGSGVMVPAAKLFFNEKGELDIENYGISPTRVTNVERR